MTNSPKTPFLAAAREAMAFRLPVVIHGPAGCGKSHNLARLAGALDHQTLDWVLDGWVPGDLLRPGWLYIATGLSADDVRLTEGRGAHVVPYGPLAHEIGIEPRSCEQQDVAQAAPSAQVASDLSCRHDRIFRDGEGWCCADCEQQLPKEVADAVIRSNYRGVGEAVRVVGLMGIQSDRAKALGFTSCEQILDLLERDGVVAVSARMIDPVAKAPAAPAAKAAPEFSCRHDQVAMDGDAWRCSACAHLLSDAEVGVVLREIDAGAEAAASAVGKAPDMADLWGEFFQAALVQFRSALAVGHYEAAAIMLAALEAIQARDTGALTAGLGDWFFPGMRASIELAPAAGGFASAPDGYVDVPDTEVEF
jgi:Zn-finger protein